MKKIMNRKTGLYLTLNEAKFLCSQLELFSVSCTEYKSTFGYATETIAEKVALTELCEAYDKYIFAFAGTVYEVFEGYRAVIIIIKNLMPDFEDRFRNYVVIG